MASGSINMSEQIEGLREGLKEYTPGTESTFPEGMARHDELLIGLYGITGCGKTSLINSLKFAASGELPQKKVLQTAIPDKIGGHTMKRTLAHIIEAIYVVDNRGLDGLDSNTMTTVEKQLDGKKGFTQKVNWKEVSTTDLDDDGTDWKRQIGCAVLVYSAQQDFSTNVDHLSKLVDLLYSKQGRYPIAVITNIDMVKKSRVEDLKTTLYASGIDCVYEVANITKKKKKLEEIYQYNLLSFLDQCTAYGDEIYIFKHHEQMEKDRQKRIEEKRQAKKRKEEELERQRRMQQAEEELRKKELETQEATTRTITALKYTTTTGGGALAGAGVGLTIGGPFGALVGAGIGVAAGLGIGKAAK